jgi:hypothetical protein
LVTKITVLLLSECPIGPRNPPNAILGDSADRRKQHRSTDQTSVGAGSLMSMHCYSEHRVPPNIKIQSSSRHPNLPILEDIYY